MMELTSTTAPGKVFSSRSELAEHYKSDWHKYNLKRREAGLALLREEDFRARLEAALALRREQEGREKRNGTDHLKTPSKGNKKKRNNKKSKNQINKRGAVMVSGSPAYDRIKEQRQQQETKTTTTTTSAEGATPEEEKEDIEDSTNADSEMIEEEPPEIEPKQSLFDKTMFDSLDENLNYMSRKYGFFIPDQEYLTDKEGLLGYCHEKIKLGHCCLYCQKLFRSWQGCQKHMISTRHTKLRYERGVDMEEFDPFYDFSDADAEFLGKNKKDNTVPTEEDQVLDEEDDDGEWEDVSDDGKEMEEDDDERSTEEEGGLYAGYEDEIAKYGFDVTPLGELIFPDGRIVGHRGLARYYKQRIAPANDNNAVVAARRAAGERLYRGRVYNIGTAAPEQQQTHESSLALARAGIAPGTTKGRAGSGILVATSGGGGYTAVSLYRYRAVVKKARRDEARAQRMEYKSTRNINRMDKKANRLMNNVSVAHAPR